MTFQMRRERAGATSIVIGCTSERPEMLSRRSLRPLTQYCLPHTFGCMYWSSHKEWYREQVHKLAMSQWWLKWKIYQRETVLFERQ